MSVLPDAVQLAIDCLSDSEDVTDQVVATRIDRVSPSDTSSRWIRITRIGGLPDPPQWLDHANLQVDCFAPPTEGEAGATEVARVALAALVEAAGYANTEGVITGTDIYNGIQTMPDTSRTPPTPRALFGVTIHTHPA